MNISRILLVNANETIHPMRVAPLGLAFIASFLQSKGYSIQFVDTPFSLKDQQALGKTILEFKPEIIALGIRNLDNSDFHGFEAYLKLPAQLVKFMRTKLGSVGLNSPVIVGGPAVTVDPKAVMAHVKPDACLLGEGESALLDYISRLDAGKQPPIIFGNGGSELPFRVKSVTELPPPKLYSWVNSRDYLKGDSGYPIQTKRGCPLSCSYCTYAQIEGSRYRFLDPQSIGDEITGAMEHGIFDFEFVDSTFNLPARHALNILQVLQKRKLFANYLGTGINPVNLPAELLESMRTIGFQTVVCTAESASNAMLKSYRKGYSNIQLREAAEKLRKLDFQTLWVFLLGGPGETPETVEETLKFITQACGKRDSIYITSGVRLYPGSPIYSDWKRGLIPENNLCSSPDSGDIIFHYSEHTPPAWLQDRLSHFQAQDPRVMLSCEGQSKLIIFAQKTLSTLGFSKPFWRYIPIVNRFRIRKRKSNENKKLLQKSREFSGNIANDESGSSPGSGGILHR